MKSLEDWVLYIFGGFTVVGAAIASRVMKTQDEHATKISEHAAQLAAQSAFSVGTKDTLERIEAKLDRVIEREHGA